MSQTEQIRKRLEAGHGLTAISAIKLFGCGRWVCAQCLGGM